jgi:diaminopimelate epimerase
MRGGDLKISWEGNNAAVMMTGPALSVFTGEIEI